MALKMFSGFLESNITSNYTNTSWAGIANYGNIVANTSTHKNYLVANTAVTGKTNLYVSTQGYTALFFGFRNYKTNIAPYSTSQSCSFGFANSSGNSQVQFNINLQSQIVNVTSGSTTIASGNLSLLGNSVYNYIECGIVLSATSGSVVLMADGGTIINVSNVNTLADTSVPNVNTFYTNISSTNPFWFNITDIYLCDNTGSSANTYLGDVTAALQPITGNSSVSFTPVGQSQNYLNVAVSNPNIGNNYNYGNTIGATDLFTITPFTANTTQIYGVQLVEYANSNNNVTTFSLELDSNGTISTSTAYAVTNVPQFYYDLLQNDPATNTTWTSSGINNSTVGYKVVS